MAKNNTVQTSLTRFGEVARDPEAGAESIMAALFQHALACQAVNPKASKVAIKGHWSVPVTWKNGVEVKKTLAEQYDIVAAKLRSHFGFDDERPGSEVLDATVAQGLLVRSRRNWIAAPGSFTKTGETVPTEELF